MLVRDCMTRGPVTVTPDTPVPDALRLMHEKKVRRLPVLDGRGKLVGIASDKDLLYASPSPATTLSMWEIPELLAKITVDKVMTRDVITVPEDTSLEEAARIMVDNKIGGLPIMKGPDLVGIITETDLFKVLLQQLGGRQPGVRVSVNVNDTRGTLAGITTAIAGVGGNIVGLAFSQVTGSSGAQSEVTVKVQGVTSEKLVAAIKPLVREIVDVREV